MTPQPSKRALPPIHLFDPEADILIVDRRLPHWSQAGALAFITWHTDDSMPTQVLDRWFGDRNRWLLDHQIDPESPNWRQRLLQLDPPLVRDFLEAFWNRWQDALDAGHGACVLRQVELAEIVANSLRFFDGVRYLMLDFVVMPNHVHVLACFPDEKAMLAQCKSWKHYAARKINRCLKQKGRFWQQDSFDHLLRSEKQFEYLRQYIAGNPEKARLQAGEFVHYSRRL
jgi:putative transposase